jgi:hypothetical protein
MLRIYPVLLELIRLLRPLVKELARHDRNLAEQCVTAYVAIFRCVHRQHVLG